MKPNGFVAAASTTSQMSIPIRSHSCASSLTSAMLTERKMFSSSFVSSAASGVETRWMRVDGAAVQRRRRLGRRVVDPTDDLGHGLRRVVDPAGIDPLRREGEMEVDARGQARAALEDRQHLVARRARDTSSTRARRGGRAAAGSRSARSRRARSRGRAPAASRAASAARSGSRRPRAARRSRSSRGGRAPRRAASASRWGRPRCSSRRGSAARRARR